MKITNHYGLPEALVRAINNDSYNGPKTGFSVTRLIAPAYQRRLMKQHSAEITEDASDRIWALLGQAAHTVLERAAREGDVVEKRYFCHVNDQVVHGQVDLIDGYLSDYKITSTYAIKSALKEGKQEWTAQLNVLDCLVRANSLHPKGLQIVAIARDWNKYRMLQDDQYPPKALTIPVKRWAPGEQHDYIVARLEAHMDPNPPPCSDEERWYSPGKSAVMKRGRKTAVRLLDSPQDALLYIQEKKLDERTHYIQNRPGKHARCLDYCPVSTFCPYWQEHKEEES